MVHLIPHRFTELSILAVLLLPSPILQAGEVADFGTFEVLEQNDHSRLTSMEAVRSPQPSSLWGATDANLDGPVERVEFASFEARDRRGQTNRVAARPASTPLHPFR